MTPPCRIRTRAVLHQPTNARLTHMRHTQVQDICSAILLGIPCCSCPGRPAVLRPASRHPYPLRTEMDRRAACHHGQAMAHGAWSLALASMAAARITVPTYLSALAACLSSRPPSLALPSCRHRSISRIKCPPPPSITSPPGYALPNALGLPSGGGSGGQGGVGLQRGQAVHHPSTQHPSIHPSSNPVWTQR